MDGPFQAMQWTLINTAEFGQFIKRSPLCIDWCWFNLTGNAPQVIIQLGKYLGKEIVALCRVTFFYLQREIIYMLIVGFVVAGTEFKEQVSSFAHLVKVAILAHMMFNGDPIGFRGPMRPTRGHLESQLQFHETSK